MPDSYLDVTWDAGAAFVRRGLAGPVVMLNLLRFRETADYSASPELAPDGPISGEAAYDRYLTHTRPLVERAGGAVLFVGHAGPWLIGPAGEAWDRAMLVRHASADAFLTFAQDAEYLATAGHRTAGLADSRLLPLVQTA